jgi:hypothetical protein
MDRTGKTNHWMRLLRGFALLFSVYTLAQNIEYVFMHTRTESGLGAIGGTLESQDIMAPGFSLVVRVQPGLPLAVAGVQAGDSVRFDRVWDRRRPLHVGESLGLTVDHRGQSHHVDITATPQRQPYTANALRALLTADIVGAIIIILGATLVWRSRNLSTYMLGVALIASGGADTNPTLMFSAPDIYPFAFLLNQIFLFELPVLFYAFAIAFFRDPIGPLRAWHYTVFAIFSLLNSALTLVIAGGMLTLTQLPILGNGFIVSAGMTYVGFLAALGYLIFGWRRSPVADQPRYALLIVAALAMILSQAIITLVYLVLNIPDPEASPFAFPLEVSTMALSPVLFTYAILRHKVLDLGFAINRTLVYGVVSAILLVAFGLAEWGIEKVIPHAYAEANTFVSAGIALVIFLVFHRVRDFVEHWMEKVLFRAWHEKEATLAAFVREAGYILKRGPMIAAYVKHLRAFCEDAECALYLADDSGVFMLAAGGLRDMPDALDPDDPFMVTVRTNRAVSQPSEGPIGLVLPMIHRTEVVGVTLLGHKPSGFSYRPDEVKALAHAAHQVGLDLHALEIERLRERVTAQDVELTVFRGLRFQAG